MEQHLIKGGFFDANPGTARLVYDTVSLHKISACLTDAKDNEGSGKDHFGVCFRKVLVGWKGVCFGVE